ncbi:hypothetical protein LTR04_004649 [Oleoguttula sp. CCFEE 6159]|nr:hypothetical protein LTR04_004649 [Oleoguttula sp. CCFEE 6159]
MAIHNYTRQDRIDTVRPAKKLKTTVAQDEDSEPTAAIPSHPLGIKPAGNAFVATKNLKHAAGFLSKLPDELIIQLLEYLDASELLTLSGTCKALYAFTRAEELWKALFIGSPPANFTWYGTWRSTYLAQPCAEESTVSCINLFSDALHRPFFCAHTSLSSYTTEIPSVNAIPRLPDLTAEEFSESWTDKPFILTSPVREWPVYQQWSTEALLTQYGDTCFRAEAVDWPLKTYVEYMNNSRDESPLYLFDCAFAEKMSLKVGKHEEHAAYWEPQCFGEDLFAVLGDQRPDSRWLIVRPERSGSTFHKDPNATSAWNAVIRGAKYWIMFPSSSSLPPPPGVFVSEDQSEVTSPLSIAEWLLGFHAEARATPGCLEGICEEGEVLHVPSGYYHLVLNTKPSIALTQNFVPRSRLGAVLEFLRDRPGQVSGFKEDVVDPYRLLVDRLGDVHPDLLQEGLDELERKVQGKKARWEDLVKGSEGGAEGRFSFGFGVEDDEDADIP